jgi:ribosome biogenesis GTPase
MGQGKRKRSRAGRPVHRRLPTHQLEDESALDDAPSREKILRGRENEGAPPGAPSAAELEGEVARGRVVSRRGLEALVEPEDGGDSVRCILRKSTRVPHSSANPLAVGDLVRWIVGPAEPHVLTEVEPRRTALTRVRRGREEHVIAANVDLAVIVASATQPPFKPRLVDRYLMSAAQGGLEPVLVVNKIDLAEPGASGEMLAPYAGLEFPAIATSATTGEGLDELTRIVQDRISVFSGQSGVGKSSLVNRLGGGRFRIPTAEVYGKAGKGRHTTTDSTLYRFPFGGGVVDTPGIRGFLLHEPTLEALAEFFPEILEAAEACRFADCAHDGDAGCALPEAVAEGRVHPDRLVSFGILLAEIRARR